MGDWAGLFEYARKRHHTLRLTDGVQFGISADTLRKRTVRERWERPYPGVVWLPGSVPGFWRTSAGVLASLPCCEAALACRTAAYAHGVIDRPTPLTEVVQPHGRYVPRRRLLTVRSSRTLVEDDVVEIGALRCTTPARTLADLAGVLEAKALRPIVIDAVQRRIVTLEQLTATCASLPRGIARSRLRQVLEGLAATPGGERHRQQLHHRPHPLVAGQHALVAALGRLGPLVQEPRRRGRRDRRPGRHRRPVVAPRRAGGLPMPALPHHSP